MLSFLLHARVAADRQTTKNRLVCLARFVAVKLPLAPIDTPGDVKCRISYRDALLHPCVNLQPGEALDPCTDDEILGTEEDWLIFLRLMSSWRAAQQ